MLWSKIKQRVKEDLRGQITCINPPFAERILIDLIGTDWEAAKGATREQMVAKYADAACAVIDKWDIRAIGKLRELFPGFFPPSLQKGDLIAEYADTDPSDWNVFVKS